jgi:methylenetetrahydrofolate dehydrogenase (NADP+)/methenyltetrahydrofolate cyclohydrolase
MMGIVLDGKKLAMQIEASLRERIVRLCQSANHKPLLATIQVGGDPASTTYVSMKVKACERIGMQSRQLCFSDASILSTDDIIAAIKRLNEDERVDGILLQHPLPMHINERACFDAIDVSKDVDGVTSLGYGRIAMDVPAYASATPAGIIALLEHYAIPIEGMHAVIVGRSPILGKPMSALLLNKNATITVCHSKTKNLSTFVRQADILIGAVGKPLFIQGDWIKTNAVVIDAGYHPLQKVGDIDLEGVRDRCYAYTPVPGGVGPMTIAMLMQQTVASAVKKFHYMD